MVFSISSKKRTKTHLIVVKTNSFVRFLEEFTAWQFAFKINWPLVLYCNYNCKYIGSKLYIPRTMKLKWILNLICFLADLAFKTAALLTISAVLLKSSTLFSHFHRGKNTKLEFLYILLSILKFVCCWVLLLPQLCKHQLFH